MRTSGFVRRTLQNRNFSCSFWRSNLISCEKVVADTSKSQFYQRSNLILRRRGYKIATPPQFLAIEPHFVRNSCRRHFKIAILPQFLAIEPHFVRKGCRGTLKIAISPQFLAIEPRFVRNGCVSCRLVGTAPCLKREIEKKEKQEERARGQERECEDVKM